MTEQGDIVRTLEDTRERLGWAIGLLERDASEAEGGNLAEVYGGAASYLKLARANLRLALISLDPSSEDPVQQSREGRA